MSATRVTVDNLRIGLRVIDGDGIIGVVQGARDAHNVFVEYTDVVGSGFYCILPACEDYDDRNALYVLEKQDDGRTAAEV